MMLGIRNYRATLISPRTVENSLVSSGEGIPDLFQGMAKIY
jgi:hypothetical protein